MVLALLVSQFYNALMVMGYRDFDMALILQVLAPLILKILCILVIMQSDLDGDPIIFLA